MSKRVKWSALRYISCKRLQTQTVLQSATLMFALHCTGWQVAGESVICECSVSETREGSPFVQLKQPATQILTALVLQQRRWARPLGTAHFATVKCQLIHQFATIQVTKFAIRSVRWTQLFSSIWPDLVDIRGLPSQKVAPIKSQCRSTDFAQWNARLG